MLTEQVCRSPFYFVLNIESGRATISAKYEKDRKSKKEDVALLK
jgi:hypothetical protein